MIIRSLFTVEETGFKGSGNLTLALAPAQPLIAASLCEPWLLRAQGPKGGHPHVVSDAVVGASTWTHRLTATPKYPRMGTIHR